MKKFLIFIPLFIVSCMKIETSLSLNHPQPLSGTKSLPDNDFKEENRVAIKDIDAYCRFLELTAESEGNRKFEIVEVIPHYDDGVLVYYVINFKEGWTIISADKRGPIVLGKSDTGNFNEKIRNINGVWFDMLADDIIFRIKYPDRYYSVMTKASKEKEEECVRKWDLVTSNKRIFESKNIDDPGHYVLNLTYTTTQHYDSGHLLNTHWRQDVIFNLMCPLKAGCTSDRCPAGCVPLAVSQVLYYLHYHIGLPQASPSVASCTGDENNYEQNFSNPSVNTWDQMGSYSDPCGYAANLIAYVGFTLGAKYKSSGTSAYMNKIKSNVFTPAGISCTYTKNYNHNAIYQNLKNSLPVIYGAHRSNSLFDWTGHAFVVDGYGEDKEITHFVYEWVYDNPDELHVAPHFPYETTEVTGTTLNYFLVNWGHGNAFAEDNTHYSISGNWLPSGYYSGDDLNHPYKFFKELVYDFSIY